MILLRLSQNPQATATSAMTPRSTPTLAPIITPSSVQRPLLPGTTELEGLDVVVAVVVTVAEALEVPVSVHGWRS